MAHTEPSQAIGADCLLYHTAGHDYQVSGGSFFQTNRYLIDKLVEVVVGRQTDEQRSSFTPAPVCSPLTWRGISIRCWQSNLLRILWPTCAGTFRLT